MHANDVPSAGGASCRFIGKKREQVMALSKYLTIDRTHHFAMIGVITLLDEGEVVLAQTTLQPQQVRKYPRFVL